MTTITQANVLIIATHGFEQSELGIAADRDAAVGSDRDAEGDALFADRDHRRVRTVEDHQAVEVGDVDHALGVDGDAEVLAAAAPGVQRVVERTDQRVAASRARRRSLGRDRQHDREADSDPETASEHYKSTRYSASGPAKTSSWPGMSETKRKSAKSKPGPTVQPTNA